MQKFALDIETRDEWLRPMMTLAMIDRKNRLPRVKKPVIKKDKRKLVKAARKANLKRRK